VTATVLRGVTVVPGGRQTPIGPADVAIDSDGIVAAIEPSTTATDGVLLPGAVDLHFDALAERRRPRASVRLPLADLVAVLDAELARCGLSTVLVGARFEDEPRRGVELEDAVELCEVVQELHGELDVDWLVHARVEVTDRGAPAALRRALGVTDRIALVSVMEHSAQRTRFASEEAHRAYYAEDWGVSEDEVAAVLARKRAERIGVGGRRAEVAAIAGEHGVPLASHDDRDEADVADAAELGASVAEFPLTLDAAHAARAAGLLTVLGAPNAVRGRSTSPGNLLVTDAIADGACDALCSDYLPMALGTAPFALERSGVTTLEHAADLCSGAPAIAIGRVPAAIVVGEPLDAALMVPRAGIRVARALWRGGLQVSGPPFPAG
jgi:alpha-D-ribose 1-methylphosphonate 5-triphosphate diphosphatase